MHVRGSPIERVNDLRHFTILIHKSKTKDTVSDRGQNTRWLF